MKTIFTLLFIFTIGLTAQAQSAQEEIKVETVSMTIVTSTSNKEASVEVKQEVARLYKFKNARIKKALSFTTKRNKSKMA